MTLLPWIAEDLGITIPQAGMAVSAYAIGVVVDAPLLTALTPRMDRKLLLILAASAFTLGNLLTILAVNLPMLLGVRFLTGTAPAASPWASQRSSRRAWCRPNGPAPRSRGRCWVSTIANTVGVPAATALGSAAGWRAAYVVIAVIGLATIVGLLDVPAGGPRTAHVVCEGGAEDHDPPSGLAATARRSRRIRRLVRALHVHHARPSHR